MATLEETRVIDSLKLDSHISKLIKAVKDENNDEIEQVKNEINAFKIETFFVDLQKRAREAVDDVSFNQIDAAITELSAIANRITTYADAIKTATKIADEGKANLLLPMLASQSGRMMQVISALKTASDAVKDQFNNTQEYGSMLSAISTVMASVQNLQKKVENLS